jgi:hypothetical protein
VARRVIERIFSFVAGGNAGKKLYEPAKTVNVSVVLISTIFG